jgi:soluble lytic murein transglycosylase-like protein
MPRYAASRRPARDSPRQFPEFALPTSPAPDSLRAAALVAGLALLGGVAVASLAPPALLGASAAKTAEIPVLVSTPQVAFPQPVFDAENAMPPDARLARWDGLIDAAAKRFKVPREWIVEVMRQESGGRTVLQGDVPITSVKGAMGLMQVLPQTYRDMRLDYRLGEDPYDPHDNVMAGAAYIRFLQGKYGYPALFAAYNDGPGNLEANLAGRRDLPAETIAYLTNIRVHLGDAPQPGESGLAATTLNATVTLTRPDGQSVTIDGASVKGVRAVLPGEYPPTAAAVIDLGASRQAVREDVAAATQLLKKAGAKL